MASSMMQNTVIRERKLRRRGRARKHALEHKGTTLPAAVLFKVKEC